jgi:hypothetical protein
MIGRRRSGAPVSPDDEPEFAPRCVIPLLNSKNRTRKYTKLAKNTDFVQKTIPKMA